MALRLGSGVEMALGIDAGIGPVVEPSIVHKKGSGRHRHRRPPRHRNAPKKPAVSHHSVWLGLEVCSSVLMGILITHSILNGLSDCRLLNQVGESARISDCVTESNYYKRVLNQPSGFLPAISMP